MTRQPPQKRAARGRKSILREQDMGRDGTRVKNDPEGVLRVFLKRGAKTRWRMERRGGKDGLDCNPSYLQLFAEAKKLYKFDFMHL